MNPLFVKAPLGHRHIFDATIERGDLWFRPYDGVWVEVGAALVGSKGRNPGQVCARREGRVSEGEFQRRMNLMKSKFDKPPTVCETTPVMKLYNIGAYGIPDCLLWQVRSWNLDLFWSTHALTEAVDLVKNLGIPQSAFPKSVAFGTHPLNDWEVVELEAGVNGSVTKVVARRPIRGTKWSLVIVINIDGVVRTCWVNLTSDTHRTLDISKYSKA